MTAIILASAISPNLGAVTAVVVGAITAIAGAWSVAYGVVLKCRRDREMQEISLERERRQLEKDFPDSYRARIVALELEKTKLLAAINYNSESIETITGAMDNVSTIPAKIIK